MEVRVKKYRQLSPDRAKVWKEPSPKCPQIRKVPVVYYLCRNRQLEHPHIIDVPLSSTEGLYLRDVIDRINVLRGQGMASMYSWSSKRSYKNGFVWHDLCEDDLILPSNGNEYVLKASELFQEPTSAHLAPTVNAKLQNPKQIMEPASTRSNEDSSSSSSLNGIDRKHSHDDEFSPPVRRSTSPCESPESTRAGKSSPWNGPLSLAEYKVFNSEGLADASTQTEETMGKPRAAAQETCTRGVSTDDGSLEPEINNSSQNQVEPPKDSISSTPPPSSSSGSSSNGKIDTLESLIQADVRTMNSFRIMEEEDIRDPSYRKVKASNMLMQLISCGSLSVKDHRFGIVPTYRPRFSHTNFGSPLFSTSLMLGELDCLSENTRLMGLRLEDKGYFSGSLAESSMMKGGNGLNVMKRSSSYNADRTCNQPRSESMRSAVSSNGNSRRFTEEASHGSKQTKEVDSSSMDKVMKIEERLASGARVIIQSTAVPVERCEL
ncbi:protein SOSEKI 3-like [Impatiens glandulifera]|uniref:protein SOSEKI 3-like n=1 Tax=Impatiens glandulifera TaxID=253017 RepID=UPI001FB0F26F|nr:protein SOSEKI 3-like [Impatiens glandulifera]